MGRIRAMTSKSAVDRDVQAYVAAAQRSVQQALEVCKTASRADGGWKYRTATVERDLRRSLDALGSIRRLTPVFDMDDPDLLPEALRKPITRPVPEPQPEPEVEPEIEPEVETPSFLDSKSEPEPEDES